MPPAYLKTAPEPPARGSTECDGKQKFSSPALAYQAAGRKENRKHYRCDVCGFYHTGGTLDKHAIRNSKTTKEGLVRSERSHSGS